MAKPAIEKLKDEVDLLHSANINVETRTLYLMGDESYVGTDGAEGGDEPGVEYVMANTFIRNLTYLVAKSNDPITIHMKTCGGSWAEGIAIYEAIKYCPAKIIIVSYTHARSMSSIIFSAADLRVMMPMSTFMFHRGTNSFEGTVTQFHTEAEQSQLASKQMLNIYVERMREAEYWRNSTEKQMKAWLVRKMNLKEEVYLSAREAVEFGFADLIVGEDDLTPYNVRDYLE